MTVTDFRSPLTADLSSPELAPSLAEVERALMRAVEKVSGGQIDDAVREVIAKAITAFIEGDARPRVAAARVAAQIRDVGAAQVRAGRTPDDISLVFARMHGSVMSTLSMLLTGRIVGDDAVQLRLRVKEYLHVLCLQTVAGMKSEHTRQSRVRDGRLAIAPSDAAATNGDRAGLVRVLVAVHDELPDEVRFAASLHARDSAFEVLVPEDVALDELAATLTSQVVYGPLTTWADLPDALALAWRAAAIVRERGDDRMLVPCHDLAGDLLVNSNGVLQSLLVHKHLAELSGMSVARRADLSETLLHWLERGLPVNQLARQLGLPPQTLHSRIKTLRDVFGDRLDDPLQRLELIVALRAVVHQWRRPAC